MRFGVNYVPARNWWNSWVDFEPSAIAEDLATIGDLGMDHIRVQLIWPVFQPDPSWVSPQMLDRLTAFMDLADAADLDVCVTVLDGWLSGMYLRPFWHGEDQNVFVTESLLRAEELLLREVGAAIGHHPRLLGLDVGNEPNVLVGHAGNTGTTPAQADAWTARMLQVATDAIPDRMHVVGFDHVPWLTDTARARFSRETIGATGSATAVHAWTFFTGAIQRYGAFGTGSLHLGEYMVELAAAFRTDPTRPVWLQEYGASREWMPEERLADHAEAFTRNALTCPDLWGVTWWCSHDIDRRFSAFVELEYELGLLTVQNQVKPAGERLRELIREARAEEEARQAGTLPAPRRTCTITLPAGRTPDLEFADEFFARVEAGERPRIVRAARAVGSDGAQAPDRGATPDPEEGSR
jgi:endo-1,4-beta-mannosidase